MLPASPLFHCWDEKNGKGGRRTFIKSPSYISACTTTHHTHLQAHLLRHEAPHPGGDAPHRLPDVRAGESRPQTRHLKGGLQLGILRQQLQQVDVLAEHPEEVPGPKAGKYGGGCGRPNVFVMAGVVCPLLLISVLCHCTLPFESIEKSSDPNPARRWWQGGNMSPGGGDKCLNNCFEKPPGERLGKRYTRWRNPI